MTSSLVFLLLLWTRGQGQYRLIGSDQPIIAAPDDDVILPCRVHPDRNMEESTVEWSRPDLQNLPSDRRRGVDYVFMYRFRKVDRDMMMASYVHRTSLSADGLKHGDASLRIRNVTLEDNGRFRCFIPNLRREAEVLLSVDPEFARTTTTSFHTNPVTPEPQNKTIRTDRWSRLYVGIVPAVLVFLVFLVLIVFLYVETGSSKQTLEEPPDCQNQME